jgi:peptidyl-prolyl cis-trans isomerase A (cyclophilin A)
MRPSLIATLACLASSSLVAQTHRPAPSHAAPAASVEPTGPTAVFDTSAGRITCKLFSKQAPQTVAAFLALAKGEKDWTDAAGVVQHGKPFYDATQLIGVTDGFRGGDREAFSQGSAGPAVEPEKTGLDTERPGRLVAVVKDGKQNVSAFVVLDHSIADFSKRGVVFGQCDEASIPVTTDIAHTLLSADNRPPHPIVLRRVVIVEAGQELPPPAPPIEGEADLTIPPLPAPAVPAPEPTGPTAVIETSMGTLTCKLFEKEAPIGVANFVGLASGAKSFKNPTTGVEVKGRHFYDGLHFARVIPDFMIQNNDRPFDPKGDHDIGFHFGNEIAPGLTFDRPGRLAYANAGPNTNNTEFFVTEHPIHRLDGSYTIFGQCDDASVKAVEAIARVPRDDHDKPLAPITIKRVTIISAKE